MSVEGRIGRGDLKALTSLRFVAALMVFSWHCVTTRQLASLFSFGYIGVSFFFLLSGFILTYTYHRDFAHGLSWSRVRSFYIARFARIYPLHVVTMPFMILCLVAWGNREVWDNVGPATRLGEVVAQVVLVQSWFPDVAIHFGGNGPAWSISVEAFFYAMLPLIAYALSRLLGERPPWILLLTTGGIILLYISALIPQSASMGDWRWYVFPITRLVDFIVGMIVGLAFIRGSEVTWRVRASILEAFILGLTCLAIVLSPFVPLALRFSALLMPFWASIVFVFAHQRGAISKALSHPLLVRLGEVSFAFYLIHLTVIVVSSHVLGANNPASFPVMFMVTLGTSFALFHWVETPMRRWVRWLALPHGEHRQDVHARS